MLAIGTPRDCQGPGYEAPLGQITCCATPQPWLAASSRHSVRRGFQFGKSWSIWVPSSPQILICSTPNATWGTLWPVRRLSGPNQPPAKFEYNPHSYTHLVGPRAIRAAHEIFQKDAYPGLPTRRDYRVTLQTFQSDFPQSEVDSFRVSRMSSK